MIPTPRRIAATLPALLLAAALLLVTGCQPYTLRGKVIAGDESAVRIIDADDPALTAIGPPIDEASVEITLDPRSLGRETLARTQTDPDGTFEAPLDRLGMGVLEYEIGVVARKQGRNPAQEFLDPPSPDKRLLITLAPGQDTLSEPDDPFEGTEPYLPPEQRR